VYLGLPGDLLLTVNVKTHETFKREGQNIYSDVALSLTDALLGCKITIDSIDGKISIEVKPGVNDGDQIVMKHKGVPMF
jgi:molecular chaperone DnaJ